LINKVGSTGLQQRKSPSGLNISPVKKERKMISRPLTQMSLEVPILMDIGGKNGEKSKSYLDKFVESTQKLIGRTKSPYFEVQTQRNLKTEVHGKRKIEKSYNSSRVRQFPTMGASPSK
jgi:hypothetical protein